eukprot:CAMPEP_0198329738 /NCGR_PEP_ID=MMETSP1450-20131203/16411_1 /TAXON_ID=753684 ORGANISM="Madagascaria erythrocladiodes, Strain CCMP3234" /NCGR_SAMPLE_ID=MMETSP1450 /ASSEMBLY_ACC=CAM_ASM_001115 /LENGTH=371 /DNA_ID=CAMNT_0044033983 /DNA_START=30 /DNA_END=1145 /DNA_ORIENTATION=+
MTSRAAQRVRLGWSELEVSRACLGTMTWGVQNTEADAHAQLDFAIKDIGLNFLDTAEIYPVPASAPNWSPGATEKYIGTWLAKNQDLRPRIVIASKVAGYMKQPSASVAARSDPPGEPKPATLDYQSVMEACAASLRRLQTDYIDLYQVHWPSRAPALPIFGRALYDAGKEVPSPVPIEETLRAMKDLLQAGKIRHYGLSNETPFGVGEWVRKADEMGVPRPISIQNEFNLCNRIFEDGLVESCTPTNYNIGLLPWSPLCGGRLSGKYMNGNPAGARFTDYAQFQGRFSSAPVDEAIAKYAEVAKKAKISLTSLALSWCASRPYVASTIIGATTLNQLKEDIEAFDVPLSEETLAEVDDIHFARKSPAVGP